MSGPADSCVLTRHYSRRRAAVRLTPEFENVKRKMLQSYLILEVPHRSSRSTLGCARSRTGSGHVQQTYSERIGKSIRDPYLPTDSLERRFRQLAEIAASGDEDNAECAAADLAREFPAHP